MKVHVYTFRNENHHLRWDYGQDPYVEYQTFLDLGVDGFFTDFPGSLRRFLDAKAQEYRLALSIASFLFPKKALFSIFIKSN